MHANAIVRRCLSALTAGEAVPADAELLARYIAGDQGAFADLVQRHGPMVLAACRRVLGHSADAEDAFQTTFAALARHAATIRGPAALPAWLHRTALRAANRARSREPRPTRCRPTRPIRLIHWRMWPGATCAACSTGARPAAGEVSCAGAIVFPGRVDARRGRGADRLLPQYTQAAAGGGAGAAPGPTDPSGCCAPRLAAGVLDSDGLRAQVPERLIEAAARSASAGLGVRASLGAAGVPARGIALAGMRRDRRGARLGAMVSSAPPPRTILRPRKPGRPNLRPPGWMPTATRFLPVRSADRHNSLSRRRRHKPGDPVF